jgi:hypothetical protein
MTLPKDFFVLTIHTRILGLIVGSIWFNHSKFELSILGLFLKRTRPKLVIARAPARSNLPSPNKGDCFVASLFAMTR